MSENKQNEWSKFVHGAVDVNVLLGFLFGIVFLSIMLSFAIIFPNPTQTQENAFMVALSLSAAGVAAVIPGNLEISYKNYIRGGGALAVFVLVWLSKPAIIDLVGLRPLPESDNPQLISDRFLILTDSKETKKMYEAIDPDFIKATFRNYDEFVNLFTNSRYTLTDLLQRKLIGKSPAISPPGAPAGSYYILVYKSQFSGEPSCRMEQVTLRLEPDQDWKVYNYTYSPVMPRAVRFVI